MLDTIYSDVSKQVDDQRELGVQITRVNDVPETGPVNKGVWFDIPKVSAVFVDMKNSTDLNSHEHQLKDAARTYTYFVRAMAVIFERFSARYVDIQGDGLFGLFSGENSLFEAAACAITMKTYILKVLAAELRAENSVDWELSAGIGMDEGRIMVRRLGLRETKHRGTKQNEVWAGTPVNMAAKLSSLAEPNQLVVSERVFNEFERASKWRRRALIRSCGCDCSNRQGRGLDAGIGETICLWKKAPAPNDLGLDFENLYRLDSKWCEVHGSEFCEAIVTGKRNDGQN